jgi:hypothetical protein
LRVHPCDAGNFAGEAAYTESKPIGIIPEPASDDSPLVLSRLASGQWHFWAKQNAVLGGADKILIVFIVVMPRRRDQLNLFNGAANFDDRRLADPLRRLFVLGRG